jgi:hypothetical protein
LCRERSGDCRATEKHYKIASLEPIELHPLPQTKIPWQDTALATIKSGPAELRNFDPGYVGSGAADANECWQRPPRTLCRLGGDTTWPNYTSPVMFLAVGAVGKPLSTLNCRPVAQELGLVLQFRCA